MTYVITKKCDGVCDTACVNVCPCDCIIGPAPVEELRKLPVSERAGIQMFIDPDECINCGACLDECPVAAIYDEADVPAAHRDDIARNAAFFTSKRS